MAQNETRGLPVKATGTGALTTGPTWVADLDSLEVQVQGTFVATVQIQGSLDGATWVTIGSNITAPGIVAVAGNYQYLRINTSAYTSGTPVAEVCGKKRHENEIKAPEFKLSVAAGAAVYVGNLASLEVQVVGSGTWTVDVEGSHDGTTFTKIGSTVSAAGFVAVTQPMQYFRLNTKTFSSGTPTAFLCGKPQRPFDVRVLDAKSSVAQGAGSTVEELTSLNLHINLAGGTNTVQVMGSLDGVNFFQIGSDVTATSFVAISPVLNYVALNTTVYDTGTITAVLIGRIYDHNGVAAI
jgi:hypothetical protein